MVQLVMPLESQECFKTSEEPKVLPLLHHRFVWWTVFLGATVVLSWVFQGFRDFTMTPTLGYGMLFLGQLFLLTLLMAVLTYDSYVKEKHKQNIHHRVALFEWLYASQMARSARRRN